MKAIAPRPRLWLLGALLATALMLCVALFFEPHFAVSDDKAILRAFADYQPGGAVDFHLYIHPLLALPLCWLSHAVPVVPWYTVLLLGMEWFSITVLVRGVLACFLRARQPLWLGFLLSVCMVITFVMQSVFQITYTVTAALLGAAAVAQIMSLDVRSLAPRAVFRGAALSLILVALAYALRQMTALPILALCGVAFMMRWLACKGVHGKAGQAVKPLIWTFVTTLAVMAALVGWREAEIRIRGQEDYLRWQQARIRVMDYVDLDQVDEAVFRQVGWSEEEVAMIQSWYLADENITTEALETVYQSQSGKPNWLDARNKLLRFAQLDPLGVRAIQAFLCLGAACLLGVAAKRRDRLAPFIGIALTGLLCAAMALYLAFSGRVLMRGLMQAILPGGALLCCLFPQCLPQRPEGVLWRRTLSLVAFALVLASTARYVLPAVSQMGSAVYEQSVPEQMDTLASSRPDTLFFFHVDCGNDLRLFPDRSKGVPTNLVSLGTWERGSVAYQRQLAAFGLDGEHLNPADFLNDNVRIISTNGAPPQNFFAYLQSDVSPNVQWEREQVDGLLYVYRFFLPQ